MTLIKPPKDNDPRNCTHFLQDQHPKNVLRRANSRFMILQVYFYKIGFV